MRRWFITIAIFLVAGAAVNVAVAAGCALWSPITHREKTLYPADAPPDVKSRVPEDWLNPPGAGFPTTQLSYSRRAGFGIRIIRFSSMPYGPGTTIGPGRLLHVERAGWPFLSLGCHGYPHGERTLPHGTSPYPQDWRGGLPAPGILRPQIERIDPLGISIYSRPLPSRPIWIAFIANTFAYATLLGLASTGPFALRRHLRRRHGLCPICTYPMSESAVCTECGKPLPQHAVV